MRLPPLCRYLRGLILFLRVLLAALGADLGSLLADLGSLLGVSLGFWGGKLPAATKNLKNNTPLQPQALLTKQASPVCVRCTL